MGKLWEKSGQIEFDNNGDPAGGCEARFFVGGTGTTPITVYSDAAETTPRTDPVEADANGRWPIVFIPFRASYDVKVSTEGGTQLYFYQSIPNADPVEASEDSVDDNQLLQTGDWLFTTKTGTRSGFVRANGRTIGSASSGATERANADTEDLYAFLWDNHADGICAVTSGRGASAAADFAANKPIALFDCRSAGPMGLDDMGNSAQGNGFSGSFTTGNATTGGSVGGANAHVLVTGELAAHTHSFSTTTDSGGSHSHTGTTDSGGAHTHTATTSSEGAHTHNVPIRALTGGSNTHAGPSDSNSADGTGNCVTSSNGAHTHSLTTSSDGNHTHTFTTGSGGAHTHTLSGTTGSNGSGSAHNNMSRHVLGTWYLKL